MKPTRFLWIAPALWVEQWENSPLQAKSFVVRCELLQGCDRAEFLGPVTYSFTVLSSLTLVTLELASQTALTRSVCYLVAPIFYAAFYFL